MVVVLDEFQKDIKFLFRANLPSLIFFLSFGQTGVLIEKLNEGIGTWSYKTTSDIYNFRD